MGKCKSFKVIKATAGPATAFRGVSAVVSLEVKKGVIYEVALLAADVKALEYFWFTVARVPLVLNEVQNVCLFNAKDTKEGGGAAANELQDLMDVCGEWSDATFGSGRNPLPALHHLAEEVGELIDEDARDWKEWADCWMLLMDATRRAGVDAQKMQEWVLEKLEINKKRKWGTPDRNGVVHHLKESEDNDE